MAHNSEKSKKKAFICACPPDEGIMIIWYAHARFLPVEGNAESTAGYLG